MYAIKEALKITEARWGHANAPHDSDMLEVIRLLKIALKKVSDFEEKFIETNQELIKLLNTDYQEIVEVNREQTG